MVVDESPRIRSRIRGLLQSEFPRAVVVETASAEEALQLAGTAAYSLILLDVRLAGRNGIQALPDLRLAQPTAPIVVLSGVPPDQDASAALRAGANAYVSKERVYEDLVGVLVGLMGVAA